MDKLLFAALSFTEDENLAGRTYWYLSDFPLRPAERVLAPVGPHDRLQAGRVVRMLEGSGEDAPYDLSLIKKIAAPYGARKLGCGGTVCLELGGVRYDDRHYTRYRKILVADAEPDDPDKLFRYGVREFIAAGEDALQRAAEAKECVLLFGADAGRLGELILSACSGDPDLPPSLLSAFRRKLC